MNSIQELLSTYGILGYGITVFFGGRWGIRFFNYFDQVKYNFLVFASVWGFVWMGGEAAAGTWKWVDLGRYALTYAAVTSCYELVADWFPFLKPKTDNNEK